MLRQFKTMQVLNNGSLFISYFNLNTYKDSSFFFHEKTLKIYDSYKKKENRSKSNEISNYKQKYMNS